MKLEYFWPLLGLAVPTVVIGYGVVIPASCIAGINRLTIGFAATVLVAGGCFVLAYRPAGARGSTNFPPDVYTFHPPEEVRDFLVTAGFDAIETIRHSPELVLTVGYATPPPDDGAAPTPQEGIE